MNRAYVRHVRMPLRVPWVNASQRLSHCAYTVLTLHGDTGTTGHAIVGGLVDRRAVEQLGEAALALGSRPPGDVWSALSAAVDAAAVGARALVDLALWDLYAREVGLPVSRLLGGGLAAASWPAYASGGGYPGAGDPSEAAASEAARWVAEGWTAIKIKVGGLPPREDRRRIEAIRTVAPDIRIMADANGCWTAPAQALDFLTTIDSPVDWLEEPFPVDAIDAYAALAGATDVPLAAGEQCRTPEQLRRLVDDGGVQVLQPDATVLDGGATTWLRVAGMAMSRNVAVAPHHWPEFHVALMAAAPTASVLEYVRPGTIVNYQHLLRSRCQPHLGRIASDRRPGWGIELDESALARAAA